MREEEEEEAPYVRRAVSAPCENDELTLDELYYCRCDEHMYKLAHRKSVGASYRRKSFSCCFWCLCRMAFFESAARVPSTRPNQCAVCVCNEFCAARLLVCACAHSFVRSMRAS